MSDRLELRLSRNWAVLADRQQWILASRVKRGTGWRWKPVGYVRSTKTILARVSRENGAVMTPEAQAVLDSWPERFLDWWAQHDAGVSRSVDRFTAQDVAK